MPPRVEEMRLSEAGEISNERKPPAARATRDTAPPSPQRFANASDFNSTLPDGVEGKTFSNSTIGLPSDAASEPPCPSKSRSAARRQARVGGVDRLVHQLGVARLETRVVKAEPRGEPAENLGIWQ